MVLKLLRDLINMSFKMFNKKLPTINRHHTKQKTLRSPSKTGRTLYLQLDIDYSSNTKLWAKLPLASPHQDPAQTIETFELSAVIYLIKMMSISFSTGNISSDLILTAKAHCSLGQLKICCSCLTAADLQHLQ